jgi:hypothetical protein
MYHVIDPGRGLSAFGIEREPSCPIHEMCQQRSDNFLYGLLEPAAAALGTAVPVVDAPARMVDTHARSPVREADRPDRPNPGRHGPSRPQTGNPLSPSMVIETVRRNSAQPFG